MGAHPCDEVRDQIGALNSATCKNHHGDNADVMPKKGADPNALKVIVTEALELIGARRSAGSAAAAAVAPTPAAGSASPAIAVP